MYFLFQKKRHDCQIENEFKKNIVRKDITELQRKGVSVRKSIEKKMIGKANRLSKIFWIE